jgi:hypothetical protein
VKEILEISLRLLPFFVLRGEKRRIMEKNGIKIG